MKGFYGIHMHLKCNGTSEFVRNLHVVLYQEVIRISVSHSFIFSRNASLLSPSNGVLCMPCARSRVTCPAVISRLRLFCSAATATTWSQAAITVWCRCGRLVTSSNSTSTRAATPASEPWTCHMIRGENSPWGSRITDDAVEKGLKLNTTGWGDRNNLTARFLLFHLQKFLFLTITCRFNRRTFVCTFFSITLV